MRALEATARIFTLPLEAVMMAEEAESNMYCTRPPIRSFAASEPPLYGMCTASMPVFFTKASP